MLAPRGDRYVGRSLELYGEFSPAESRFFEQLVRPGQTIVEVGANIGAHTVALARRCAPGLLYAFEPQQRLFQLLCANLALNGVGNVRAYPEACGAREGQVRLPDFDYGSAGNFGGVSVVEDDASPGVPVRLITLDSLALPACHILKVDVEGYEAQVLRGARETILRLRPLLYVENDRPEKQQEVISLIHELGYVQYWHTPPLFDPGNFKGESHNEFPGIVSLNLFATPSERDDRIGGAEPIDPTNWRAPVGPAKRAASPES